MSELVGTTSAFTAAGRLHDPQQRSAKTSGAARSFDDPQRGSTKTSEAARSLDDSTQPSGEPNSAPADIALILRADAELRCLTEEVAPVLAQIETHISTEDERLSAASAYLEAAWLQACKLAGETEKARVSVQAALNLDSATSAKESGLAETARAYHDTVCRLRKSLAARIASYPNQANR